jgi:crotonobetainyl-CoA:carnitine CoA-transferase CaiB-like acyl-CoA transferase
VDSTVGVLANQGMNFLASGKLPVRIGNAHPNIVPYQVFNVADGYIIIATGNDSQYVKLCGVLGAPELAKDPKYIDNKARLANRGELIGKLTTLTLKFKMQDLADKLEEVGVPAGPINNLDQVFDDPHVKHRGMKLALPSAFAKAGTIPGVRTPITIDKTPMASPRPAPRLGEHTAEILKEIGEG